MRSTARPSGFCAVVERRAFATMADNTPPVQAGLEAVFIANRVDLKSFFVARTRDTSEAEEILQEIYLRLDRSARGPIADPLSYIFRIGLNLVVDRARERQRRARREDAWGSVTTTRIGNDLVDESPSPFAEVASRQRAAQIGAALASMPPGAARAFRLHKIEGLSHKDVAAHLGITRKGVEKHMSVAFRHLARKLKE